MLEAVLSVEQARGEFKQRVKRERDKSVEKYGEVALRPDGHPDYDVLDYAINEIVGLVRYAEMIEERVRLMRTMIRRVPAHVVLDAQSIAADMRNFAHETGVELIALRSQLLGVVPSLGEPERR